MLDDRTVAEAVLAVGFDQLTFAAVAERLGIAQATLYRHTPNRDELVRLGLDLVLRRTPWPDLDGPWKPLLERWAMASWRIWERYPGAVRETTRGVVPSHILVLADRVGTALVERGFTPGNAVLAVDLVFDLAADNRRGVEEIDRTTPQQAPEREAEWDPDRTPAEGGTPRAVLARDWSAAAADGTAERIRAEMVRAIHVAPVDWFTAKLRIVLAGIEQELAPSPQEDQ